MSTDKQPKQADKSGETLAQTMQALKSVNEKTPDAKQNKSSIKDFKGNRIKLNEGKNRKNTIYGKET